MYVIYKMPQHVTSSFTSCLPKYGASDVQRRCYQQFVLTISDWLWWMAAAFPVMFRCYIFNIWLYRPTCICMRRTNSSSSSSAVVALWFGHSNRSFYWATLIVYFIFIFNYYFMGGCECFLLRALLSGSHCILFRCMSCCTSWANKDDDDDDDDAVRKCGASRRPASVRPSVTLAHCIEKTFFPRLSGQIALSL